MPSSTQFTIRSMLIVTIVVAIVSAAAAFLLRQLDPQSWPRAGLYLLLLGAILALLAAANIRRRRSVEKQAGPLLARTDLGGAPLRWASLLAAIPLSTTAIGLCILQAGFDSGATALSLYFILPLLPLVAGSAATGLFLHWWWGTGFLVTEAFQNGLVLRGLVFVPWAKIASYDRATRFIITVTSRRRTSRVEVRVAVKDRDQWEQIFAEHGVSSANSPGQENTVPSRTPDSQHATERP